MYIYFWNILIKQSYIHILEMFNTHSFKDLIICSKFNPFTIFNPLFIVNVLLNSVQNLLD